jgi:hypothetical protein
MAVDDAYTKLLLHCNGTDGSTTFIDESGKTITANGHAQIDTAQSVFGGASALFDGNGDDYLSIPQSSDFDLGSSDFTVDFRFRANAFTTQNAICMYGTLAVRGWTIQVKDAQFRFYYSTNGSTDSFFDITYDFVTGTFYHIEVGRTGGKMYVFVNGSAINAGGTTFTDTIFNANTAFVIGRFGDYTAADHSINGWVDEFRLSKGICRHTSDFTPPTSEYSPSAIKSINGLAKASVKSYNGLAIASVKNINGLV